MRVLIVEDAQPLAEWMFRTLHAHGATADIATTGEQALTPASCRPAWTR